MTDSRVPPGTRVVLHGAPTDVVGPGIGRRVVGRVVRDSGEGYTVSLGDGRLVDTDGQQVTPVRGSQPPTAPAAGSSSASLATDRAIYAAAVGPPSVDDGQPNIRAVYQAPTIEFWSLSKPPKHVAGPGSSWFSWEIERFCELALKANPTCLELLWSPRAVWISDTGGELLDLRGAFLSQQITSGYTTHVSTQLKKLEQNERQPAEQRWAHVSHLIGLLVDGAALLRTGDVTDRSTEYQQRLHDVQSGQVPWEQVEAWQMDLRQTLDDATATTFLPVKPDTSRVSAWLGDVRRRDLDTSP